jgi:hypothetical protein
MDLVAALPAGRVFTAQKATEASACLTVTLKPELPQYLFRRGVRADNFAPHLARGHERHNDLFFRADVEAANIDRADFLFETAQRNERLKSHPQLRFVSVHSLDLAGALHADRKAALPGGIYGGYRRIVFSGAAFKQGYHNDLEGA